MLDLVGESGVTLVLDHTDMHNEHDNLDIDELEPDWVKNIEDLVSRFFDGLIVKLFFGCTPSVQVHQNNEPVLYRPLIFGWNMDKNVAILLKSYTL